MPLIHGWKSTNIWKSFLLNSLASALVIFIALTVKERYDTFTDNKNEIISRTTNFKSIGLTILATCLASMIAYTLMYLVFGFGSGLLISDAHM